MYNNLRGKAISFEGGEGAGKSTVIRLLEKELKDNGCDIYVTREPGGNNIAEQIRDVIVDINNTNICSETECLLYAASRAQLIQEVISPLLLTNKTIIFDRFVDSSYVYQGYVRGLGIDKVKDINNFATKGWLPDCTIILDIEPEIGFKRIAENNRSVNRLDLEGLAFHKKVREGYKVCARMFPERVHIINADCTPEEILSQILEIIKKI